MQITIQDIQDCLKNNLIEFYGNFSINTYCIDTRLLKEGDCFIALRGNTDAHNYIEDAITKGAKSLIISYDYYSKNKIQFPNIIVVKDTFDALLSIANFNRDLFVNRGGKLVGITGSIGKTSLKDILSFILSHSKIVSSTFGNYNNNIGLPFSLSHIKEDSTFGIFEMGMSKSGEIFNLTKILKPHIAVITEVSTAHAEFFTNTKTQSSLDKIAEAKAEIIEGLDSLGSLFINKDNNYYSYFYKLAQSKNINQIYSFSMNKIDSDIYINSLEMLENYIIQAEAVIFNEKVKFAINSVSPHHALLFALSFGITKILGVNIKSIIKETINFKITSGRGNILHCNYKGRSIILIDDSYNASPKSMQVALYNISQLANPKVVILGEMLELGNYTQEEHENLENYIMRLQNIKLIILVGQGMRYLYSKIKNYSSVYYFSSYKEAIHLFNIISNNDLIFIKGSLGSGVHKLIDIFTKRVK